MEYRLDCINDDTIIATRLFAPDRINYFPTPINNLIIEYGFGSIKKFFRYRKLYRESLITFDWIYHVMSSQLTPENTTLILKCAAKYDNYDIVLSYHHLISINNALANELFDVAWKYSSENVIVRLLDRYSDILIRNTSPNPPRNISTNLFMQACMEGKMKLIKRFEKQYNFINSKHYKDWSFSAFEILARKGDLKMLEWLFNLTHDARSSKLPIIIARAYGYDHVHILNWLKNDIKLTDEEWNKSSNFYHDLTIAPNISGDWLKKYNLARNNTYCIVQ
jgi:hypothetical protein